MRPDTLPTKIFLDGGDPHETMVVIKDRGMERFSQDWNALIS